MARRNRSTSVTTRSMTDACGCRVSSLLLRLQAALRRYKARLVEADSLQERIFNYNAGFPFDQHMFVSDEHRDDEYEDMVCEPIHTV